MRGKRIPFERPAIPAITVPREGPTVRLKQLTYLRKAIEAGNITRAAAELNVAQTALGIQIRNLEDELGVKLLERHSRGVVPTPAGEELARHALGIAGRMEEARQAMQRYRGGESVRVTLGVTPSIVRLVGDDILMELAATIPNVALRLVEEFSFVLMRQLERGELTCALTYAPEIGERLAHRALLEEDLFHLTAPGVAGEGEIGFREVMAGDLALTGRQDAVFRIVQGMARRLGIELSVAYEVQSIRAVKNLVAKGVAATIMPYGAAEGELRSGVLKRRLIVAPRVTRVLSFVHPREQAGLVDTPEFRGFVDAVADRLVRADGPVCRRL